MKKVLLIFIFLYFPLFANIDAQIEAIQKAPVEERFKLMNAFKQEIVQMQEKERIDAMSKLQSITRSKHANKAFKELRGHHKSREAKEHVRKKSSHIKQNIEHEEDADENVENTTETSVENQTENETESQTETETENETENQTENSVENNTEDSVQEQTQEQTTNETENHVEQENETEDHEEEEHDND